MKIKLIVEGPGKRYFEQDYRSRKAATEHLFSDLFTEIGKSWERITLMIGKGKINGRKTKKRIWKK